MSTTDEQPAASGIARALVSAWVPNRRVEMPRWVVLVCAIGAQVVVTFAIDQANTLALAQAVAVFGVGMYAVLKRDLGLMICVIAYIAGAEILWRQVRAPVYYQAAPYLVTVLSVYVVFVVLGRVSHTGRMAMLYMGLLLPACITTIATVGGGARALIAFALAGPMALGAFVAFTSQMRIQRWLYFRVLWVLVITAFGPFTIAVLHLQQTLATGTVTFGTQSNFDTSGGFGPVQVSSILGLGVLAALILAMHEEQQTVRLVAAAAGVTLAIQSLLTFSRGGMFSVAIAAGVFIISEVRTPQARLRAIMLVFGTLALGYYVVVPRIDTFTHGAFATRFTNADTGRTQLANNDLQIFKKHAMLGVGPGMTKYQRISFEDCKLRSDQCFDEASSHTEFTRMLGEHGLPGAGAILVLIALMVSAARGDPRHRSITITLLTWAVAQMFYANLRLAAVPIVFGLAFLRIADPGDPVDVAPQPPKPSVTMPLTGW